LTFLLLVGYSFDRFVLGIVFVLNVAIGHATSEWLKSRHPLRVGLTLAAAAALLISAVHMPRLLANDSRYGVERYIEQTVPRHEETWIYSLGAERFAPRVAAHHDNVHYKTYAELAAEGPGNPVPASAGVAILVYMFPPSSGEESRQLLDTLLGPGSGFSLAYEAKTRYFFDPDSLPFVNPRVYVFRRPGSSATTPGRSGGNK
jgi:hypothetical protein